MAETATRSRNSFLRFLAPLAFACAAISLAQCASDSKPQYGFAGTQAPYAPLGDSFYAQPYPNDLRFDAAARTIDLHDFPNPKANAAVAQIVGLAGEHRSGFGIMPVASFAFDGPIDAGAVPSDVNSPPAEPYTTFFLNIDPESARYGERIPAMGRFHGESDPYMPANLLTLAPWPGLTLAPGSRYAAVVLRSLGAADGKALGQDERLGAALAGDSAARPDLRRLFKPLAAYSKAHGDLETDSIAAATVFSTGDPVHDMLGLVQDAKARFRASVAEDFTLVHNEAAFCDFEGRVTFPQFQTGSAPYAKAGAGVIGTDTAGRIVRQRTENVRVVLTVPTGAMPAHGFPTVQYTHGSGGVASEMIDRGKVLVAGGPEEPWRGPAYHAAMRGYAAVGQAMPISPDRVPHASSFDYLQLSNLASMAGNFQQGTMEMALLRALLYSLTLPAGSCPGLDTGGQPIRFDSKKHVLMGQSMGAMYTNIFGALVTDATALIPTGSGGYWSFFLFGSEIVPDAENVLSLFLGVPGEETLDHLHPVLGLFQQYAETVDPLAFVSRIVREPLPAIPAKHLYVPYGYDDRYFNRQTQRAIALGYGVPLQGDLIDGEMGSQLTRFRSVKASAYPVALNVKAGDDQRVTAMQAQFPEDPIQKNGHTVYAQRDEVIFQYGCFLESLAGGGKPAVPAPDAASPDGACP
jgi:hypothetical protein